MQAIKDLIRTIPDWPKPGIQFRDITTLLKDPRGLRMTIDAFAERCASLRLDKIAGVEARGFILGGALAYQLNLGFVPLRKKGKLPGECVGHDYALEYGYDRIEMHVDAIAQGERVLVLDDLLATGGTAEAAAALVRRAGGEVVECHFIVDLPDLGGRKRLEKAGLTVFTLCEFEGD